MFADACRLISGVAKYYAVIVGACTSLRIQSPSQDWMIEIPIQIYSDSSAARSGARRRGIRGRLRHAISGCGAE